MDDARGRLKAKLREKRDLRAKGGPNDRPREAQRDTAHDAQEMRRLWEAVATAMNRSREVTDSGERDDEDEEEGLPPS
jgi:hypothetical protein